MPNRLKIGIAGCAGTGKSTLARAIATEMDLEYIPSKEVTHTILERDNYNYEFGIQIERFLANPIRQKEILIETISKVKDAEGSFVSDKTFADIAAYSLAEMSRLDPDFCKDIVEECRTQSAIYSHVFVCPWHGIKLVDNSKRTLNPYYQLTVYGTILGLLEEFGIPYHILRSEDTDDRVNEIHEVLEGLKK